MVQAFPPDAPDDALRIGILPRTSRGREHLLHAQARGAPPKPLAIYRITIPEWVLRGRVPGKGLDELLRGPLGGRVCGRVEMDYVPSGVGQHAQDDEHLDASRGGR